MATIDGFNAAPFRIVMHMMQLSAVGGFKNVHAEQLQSAVFGKFCWVQQLQPMSHMLVRSTSILGLRRGRFAAWPEPLAEELAGRGGGGGGGKGGSAATAVVQEPLT
mmetsp:Transcript_75520/g.145998  ORF Transcript_75520/g.145998 Transcript_75520/m.145998 type:complete len:107 (+) Transcript_75520:87-407(+)